MVRPRKIPNNYVPLEWTDSEDDPQELPPDPDPAELAPEFPRDFPPNSELDNEEPNQNFHDLLEDVSKQWLRVEMTHDVSKKASELFWEVAKTMFHTLVESNQRGVCKIPTFTHIRRKLVKKYSPEVEIDVAYKHKVTGDVILQSDIKSLPVTKYKKPSFEPLYEIASVNVRNSKTL